MLFLWFRGTLVTKECSRPQPHIIGVAGRRPFFKLLTFNINLLHNKFKSFLEKSLKMAFFAL
jgi:hypothetical protein